MDRGHDPRVLERGEQGERGHARIVVRGGDHERRCGAFRESAGEGSPQRVVAGETAEGPGDPGEVHRSVGAAGTDQREPRLGHDRLGQVGRGDGRSTGAYGVALSGREDRDIQNWFIDMAFATEAETSEVLSALGSSDGLSLPQIQGLVNVRHKRIESMMKILEVEGAVYRTGSRWFRSATPWVYPAERIDRVTAHRRAEQGAMVEYVATDGCLMELLRTELDDPEPSRAAVVRTARERCSPPMPTELWSNGPLLTFAAPPSPSARGRSSPAGFEENSISAATTSSPAAASPDGMIPVSPNWFNAGSPPITPSPMSSSMPPSRWSVPGTRTLRRRG